MAAIDEIWLIDDDNTSNFLAARLLNKEEIINRVVSFESVQTALAALKTHAAENTLPDVILLDINMPVLNGFAFLQKIHDEQINIGSTRIYMLTSSGNPADKAKAIVSPITVSGYIVKPLTKNKIDQLIERQKAA